MAAAIYYLGCSEQLYVCIFGHRPPPPPPCPVVRRPVPGPRRAVPRTPHPQRLCCDWAPGIDPLLAGMKEGKRKKRKVFSGDRANADVGEEDKKKDL